MPATGAPLTLFGNIRTEMNGRVDLKKGGLLPLFTSARVLSIRHGVRVRSTPGLQGRGGGRCRLAHRHRAIVEAHRLLLGIILDQQLADAEAGVPCRPRWTSPAYQAAREELRAALGSVRSAIGLVAEGRF